MATNYRTTSSAPGFGQLFDLVVRHSQNGPYVLLVHALPDLVIEGLRRLRMLGHNGGKSACSRNKRPTTSQRPA